MPVPLSTLASRGPVRCTFCSSFLNPIRDIRANRCADSWHFSRGWFLFHSFQSSFFSKTSYFPRVFGGFLERRIPGKNGEGTSRTFPAFFSSSVPSVFFWARILPWSEPCLNKQIRRQQLASGRGWLQASGILREDQVCCVLPAMVKSSLGYGHSRQRTVVIKIP